MVATIEAYDISTELENPTKGASYFSAPTNKLFAGVANFLG
jgi:hypothetical protein